MDWWTSYGQAQRAAALDQVERHVFGPHHRRETIDVMVVVYHHDPAVLGLFARRLYESQFGKFSPVINPAPPSPSLEVLS